MADSETANQTPGDAALGGPIRFQNAAPQAMLVGAAVVALLFASVSQAVAVAPRPQDSVWLVSARGVPGCCQSDQCAESFTYRTYNADCQWETSDLAGFLQQDGEYDETVVFVHGNQIPSGYDKTGGLWVYGSLIPEDDPRSIRFVIFSWPSEKVSGPLRDVREKASRVTPAAHHLAALLVEIDPQTPLGLIGYSFGGPVITGALQLAAGGRLSSYHVVANPAGELETVRAALLVSAQDRRNLAAGGAHELAGELLDNLLLITNCCDPAMKWFRLVERHSKPVALGSTGLGGYRTLLEGDLAQLDACRYIGDVHDIAPYLCTPALMAAAWSAIATDEATPAAESSSEPASEVASVEGPQVLGESL